MDMKESNYISFDPPYGWISFSLSPEDLRARSLSGMIDITNREIVPWLYNNIKNCEQNAQWYSIATLHVHLRRRKDATLFALRWA